MISNVVLVQDLLRGTRIFPDAFFDLIREPIRQGCGIDIGFPPGGHRPHGLRPGFEIETFRSLATQNGKQNWDAIYHRLPEPARDYMAKHLPHADLLISFEMSPWLIDLCETAGISFLDMRVSPLRFGRDLYIALRTSRPTLYQRLSELAVSEEELRLEVAHLAANVNLQKRRLEEAQRYDFRWQADSAIFVGQTPCDASLIRPDVGFLRCEDFADDIRRIAKGRPLLHKPHPFAVEFSEHERQMLSKITGQPVKPCLQNAYQILSAEENIQLISISSGLLQEATWFGKTAHTLFQPFVPLAGQNEVKNMQAYQQVHYHQWISPGFWHGLLTPERAAPRLTQITTLPHNHGRETLDQWWDYSKVLTWERSLPYEAFMRSGGAQFRDRIADLEKIEKHESLLPTTEFKEKSDGDELNQELPASLYSRLSDGYRNVDEALSKNTSLGYQNKTLDSLYYQDLHDNNQLFQKNNWLLPYANFIRNKRFSSIREIGCGNGAFSAEIAKSVERVIGLDWAKSPTFPEKENISFQQQDVTTAELELVDLNCSADVLEHIAPEKLVALINKLHLSAHFNFHVIACYDDGHSHLSILPPDAWLFLFRQASPDYRILDVSIRRNNISHVICAVTNI